ncbi:uncharacterized protein LOC129571519 [Sitodiplosis mosellana]|uniref:uncharacterized protein LOC129571519 n=1 Tax=Sitodiplosis mosellana TaxID=263140 RepID=UPI00244396E9|nr:uncharacterized protein LOC129571519 [Sitodiplosis mosellana]
MTSTENVHDTFCWHCCTTGTTLKCSGCIRSFHTKCELPNETDATEDENWICSVCTRQMNWNMVNVQDERETLPILIDRVWNVNKFMCLKNPLETDNGKQSGSIVNPIDLTEIKAKTHSYGSLYELYTDVQWLLHNCVILYSENDAKTMAARYLLDSIDAEIAFIKKCTECYTQVIKHPKRWFTMTCTELHLIVWAKIVGFNYWPAKVMSATEQMVNVRFFGDYTHADIPVNNCYLYSETSPKAPRYISSQYRAALKEARLYINNICKKYGTFKYAQTKTPFDPKALKQHIEQMIPGINENRDNESRIVEMDSETTEETNDGDVESDNITVDTDEEEVNEEQSDELLQQPVICKELLIVLTRIDESNSKAGRGSKRNHVSNEVNGEPSPKRVRFCDEYGDDLCQVQVFEPAEYELEAEDIPEEPLDYSRNSEAAYMVEADENDQYIKDSENSQNVEMPQDQQSVEPEAEVPNAVASNQYVDIDDLSTLEHSAYCRLVQNMKGIQGDLLNSIHMSQLRSEALNSHLMSTRDAHAKEVAVLQAQNAELMERLKAALSERDQTVQQSTILMNTIRNKHLKEVALLKQTHDQAKLEIQVMLDEIREKNNEIQVKSYENQELKVQLVEMERSIEAIFVENANCENQLNEKYLEIIDKMRKESDRKLSERLRCKGCDKELAFCGSLCEKICKALQNPTPNGDKDPIQE